MNLGKIPKRIKDYIYENRQLLLASTLLSIAIITIIIILSVLKDDKNRAIASDGELHSFTTITTKPNNDNPEAETSTSSDESVQNTDSTPTTTLSDMDFTLPEDVTNEPQTTLANDSYKYLIKVNRLLNCVTIYTKDSKGNYTVPYKAMACSTGKNIKNTPLGTFNTSSKYTWRQMVDGTHSQYATRVYGGILFHSVPCYSPKKNQLEYEEFNKLGSPASLGCIRLTVADSKWIYDNCPSGTTVIIYDDANSPGPLGKPSVIKIPAGSPHRGWDPTDPDPANPWNSCAPTITASDITVSVGTNINLLSAVKATDTCGNDISSSVSVKGSYDVNIPGTYQITLSVTDLLGRSASKTINVNIINKSNINNNNTNNNSNAGNNSDTNNNSHTGNGSSDNSTPANNNTTDKKETSTANNIKNTGDMPSNESSKKTEETTSPN